MAYQYQFEDVNEAISDTDLMSVANGNLYNVLDGCGISYSASDLGVTIASGTVTVSGAEVETAGGTVTLTPDNSDPRWALGWIDENGDDGITHGDPAATPLVPALASDQTLIFKVLVDANLSVANNASVKLDKRYPGGGTGGDNFVISTTEPTGASAGQFWIDITDDEHPLVYVARDDGA